MNPLAEQIKDAGLANRVLTERHIGELLGGGDARRHGLVHRALKEGALTRLKRGVYLLDARYRDGTIHPFVAAQALLPGSYISFETALAYHHWIPEAVVVTASASPGRKTIAHDTPTMGRFSFHPLATREYQFLTAVDRVKLGGLTALVAQPLRALMDLVVLRKERWSGLDWLTSGMRIDESALASLRHKDFSALQPVYKHRAANEYLNALGAAVRAIEDAGARVSFA